jgi:hypothetical protein
MARLIGRLRHGLMPWRQRGKAASSIRLLPAKPTLWFEEWHEPAMLLDKLSEALHNAGVAAHLGGDFDDWDLEMRGGLFGSSRLSLAVEEHGGGKQLFRFRIRPRPSPWGLAGAGMFSLIAILSAVDGAWFATLPAAAFGFWLLAMALRDSGAALTKTEQLVQSVGTP